MSNLYMGIDVGKKFCWTCVLNEEYECVYFDRLETLNEAAWREMLGLFEGHEVHAAFEIGAHYEWMFDLLNEYCVKVEVVNTERFVLISKSQKKTDKVDAEKLAEGMWRGDLPLVYVPEKWVRKDRRLVAPIHALTQSLTSVKARIRNMLYTARLECPQTDLLGSGAQAWLKTHALPALDEQDHVLLAQLMAQMNLLEEQHQALEKLVAERVKAYAETELAQSIPGFGKLVTLAMLSAIAKIGRFATPDELSSYFGLCGKVDQSGDRLRLGQITKRGNKHVRWLLGQAITHLIKRDPKARRKYLKLRRKKKAKVARVALMRWVTTVLWRMLTNKEKYRLSGVPGCYYNRKKAA